MQKEPPELQHGIGSPQTAMCYLAPCQGRGSEWVEVREVIVSYRQAEVAAATSNISPYAIDNAGRREGRAIRS
jgi:hypothetical protein